MKTPDRAERLSPLGRRERKALLLEHIEQQRIDILVEAKRWKAAGQSLDALWQQARRHRGLLYLAGGALVVASARHPRGLIRLTRRFATGVLLIHRARRLLRARR